MDRAAGGGNAYRDACAQAAAAVQDSSLLPSARLLEAMARNHANSYVRCVLAQSLVHAGHLRNLPLPPEAQQRFGRLAEESLAEQGRIEAGDRIDFETFRGRYLSPELLKTDRRMA
jgi:glutamate--cysteine ligase